MGNRRTRIGATRRGIASSVTVAMVLTTAVVVRPSVASAALSDEQLAIRDGLQTVDDALAKLDDLEDLADALPFSNLAPTGPDGLDLANLFAPVLDNLDLQSLDATSPAGELEARLNSLDGLAPGNVTVHIDTEVSDSGITFNELSFTRMSTTPLDFGTDAFTLAGQDLTTMLELSFTPGSSTLTMPVDTSGTDPVLYVPADAPNASLTADLSLDVDGASGDGIELTLGILDVVASGDGTTAPDIEASVDFTIDWLDPDGDGQITLTELAGDGLGLFDVGVAPTSSVAVDLGVAATVDTGIQGIPDGASGTITLNDTDLTDGLDTPSVDLGPLDPFTNMGPADVLTALAQVALSLQAMQTRVGDVDLPLIGADPNALDDVDTVEGLADLLDINRRLGDFFVAAGVARPENPFELRFGDLDGNGVIDGAEQTLEDLGLDDVESIATAVVDYFGGPTPPDPELIYDGIDESLTFDLTFSHSASVSPAAVLTLNDQLAAAGVRGLVSLDGAAGVTAEVDYTVSLGVGLDLGIDPSAAPSAPPAITERVFVRTDGIEVEANAIVCGNVNVVGTIGFVEVSLADNDDDPGNACDDAGFVQLLGPRVGDTSPMVVVDLDGGADGKVTLAELFADLACATAAPVDSNLADAFDTLNRFQLESNPAASPPCDLGDLGLSGTLNVGVPPVTANASATIGATDLSSFGAATVTFSWPDVLGAPTVDGGGSFDDNFGSFAFDTENPLALFNSITDTLDLAVGAFDTLGAGDTDALLDEDIPLIGTSFRDSVEFLDGVRDELNEIAQDPAASLQLLESRLELAIAEALQSIDEAVPSFGPLPPFPDPNDETLGASLGYYTGSGADLTFDTTAYENALQSYIDTIENEIGEFVVLGYEPGNSPGAVTLRLQFKVCSDPADATCDLAVPLTKAFNFSLSDLGVDLAGLVAAESEGELDLDYSAEVSLDLGVQLPDLTDLDTGNDLPQPFIVDTSFIDLSLAGGLDAEIDASFGPVAITIGNKNNVAEDCTNDLDDDGDGFVNDGCPIVASEQVPDQCLDNDDNDGDGVVDDGCPAVDLEPAGGDPDTDAETACRDGVDDDGDGVVDDGCPAVPVEPGPADGAETACDDENDDDDDGAINDGCAEQETGLEAAAGASFRIGADVGDTGPSRISLLDGAALTSYLGATVSLDNFEPAVTCGDTAGPMVFACLELPVFISASAADSANDIYLGTITGEIQKGTDPDPLFQPTFDETALAALEAELLANLESLAWQLIGQGLKDFGTYVEDATKGAAYDADIPVIGGVLDGGAAIGETFNQELATPLGDFLETFDPSDLDQVRTLIASEVFAAIGSDLLLDSSDDGDEVTADDITVTLECDTEGDDCAGDGLVDLTDVSLQFAVGQEASTQIPFDFGFPGLRLATADGTGVEPSVEWSIDVGFGLSLDEGFYIITDGDGLDGTANTDDDAEIQLTVAVDTPDFVADIAFLGVEVDSANNGLPGVPNAPDAKPAGRSDQELGLTLEIDLPAGDGKLGLSDLKNVDPKDFLPVLEAEVDIYWPIVTKPDFGGASTSNGSLPQVSAVIDITGGASLGATGLEFTGLDFDFEQVELDLGSFIEDFLAPVLAEVQKFTSPLQPVIDIVQAPVPGVSELAELIGEDPVTLLTLFEAINGNDLTAIETLLDAITFANSIPTSTAGIEPIAIGSFGVDLDRILQTELPANQKRQLLVFDPATVTTDLASAISSAALPQGFKDQFAQNVIADPEASSADDPGFTFPAFQDLSQVFSLLVGEDVTLVRFASGPLKAELGFSQTFGPIAVGPIPLSVVVSGSASIEGRFAVGYDTKGVRDLVRALNDDDPSNDGFLSGFGLLFNGLFLDDLNAAGQDVPEIRLKVEFAAGAAIDLVVVSGGVEGGVAATLDLNLHDGGFFDPIPPANLDGKLRIDEVASFLFANPLCLFDASGRLTAFIRLFVEIDLFLVSKKFSFTVIDITLLDFENITAGLCQPPKPELAQDNGDGVLLLNMGPNAGARNYLPNEQEEAFVVKDLGPNEDGRTSVEVSAFGISQVYGPGEEFDIPGGVSKVVADGGEMDDSIRFVGGADPFGLPTIVCGGPGNDIIEGGSAGDVLRGDGAEAPGPGNDWSCADAEAVDDGNDTISGAGGDDDIVGGGGNDTIEGGSGDDIPLDGGTGDDTVNGGIGADTINGGEGHDNLRGGADQDPSLDTVADDASDDTIDGGGGDDTIDGDFGDDTVVGGPGDDFVTGGPGIDTVDGDADEDQIFGNDGDDILNGGSGDDIVFGMLGSDTITGGPDDDNLFGNEGVDTIYGDDGTNTASSSDKDVIVGDNGVINRLADPATSSLSPTAGQPLVVLEASPDGAGDMLFGDGDDDVIHGQEGADTIGGGWGDDQLHGNPGNDELSGDQNDDEMFGGPGTDTMWGDTASPGNGGDDGPDIVKGGSGNDDISGNAAGDRLFGEGGDDLLFGDAGDTDAPDAATDGGDFVYGGDGDDDAFGNAAFDIVFGEAGTDRLVGGSDRALQSDVGDDLRGGDDADVIAGDNATIVTNGSDDPDVWLVTLLRDGNGGGDLIQGNDADDRIYGQYGNDTASGGAGDDSIEGNDADDTLNGGDGDDDIVGGSSARDGVNDSGRDGTGTPDGADTIHGGPGSDFMAGDNAWISRNVPGHPDAAPAQVVLFDLGTTSEAADDAAGGSDTINGGDQDDLIFGQQDADIVHGDTGNDYIEGNDGNDQLWGDSGTDDIVGGGSANDGIVDGDRVGTGLLDVGETLVNGGSDDDLITGDNARVSRNIFPDPDAQIRLYDVETTATGPNPGDGEPLAVGGGEKLIRGGSGDDEIFGQTGDDTIEGNDGADYIEGNNGVDTIRGDGGEDDIVGGGSAHDGVIDDDRVGDGLLDAGENLVTGGDGVDWITGDNSLVNRNRPAVGRASIELFDVATIGGDAISPLTSGGDLLQGNAGNDRIFGQGNGAQSPTQTDPADGRNNDFVGTDAADDDHDRSTGTADEDDTLPNVWEGDTILGGDGDDEIEGNHGNDLIFGNGDQDDIAGGGSADDGKIWDTMRLSSGANLLDGADTIHGDDADATLGDGDVVVGDNGWITRPGRRWEGTGPDGETMSLVDRVVSMITTAPADDTFGNDYVAGNGGHDEIYGQAGDDALEGEWGSDAMVGDLGFVDTELLGDDGDPNVLCGPARFIEPQQPFVGEDVCQDGELFRLVTLYAFDDTGSDVVEGDDVMLGGDGDDWMHGGAGADLMQGDGDGGDEVQAESPLEYTTDIEDPNPASDDADRIFGGDSNGNGTVDPVLGGDGDAIWGGRGPDYLFGGNGDDMIDVRPDGDFPDTWAAWAEADIESYHGIDVAYGGWDQDALQVNVAANGPVEGDRFLDWAGVYNITYLCPATYGAYVTVRGQPPQLLQWVFDLADASGADDSSTLGTSGSNEVAMVDKKDVKDNTNPIYPGTPGHFTCSP